MKFLKFFVVLVLLVAWASPAHADWSVNVRPADNPAAPLSLPDLQAVFDGVTTAGPGIDAVNDQTQWALFTNEAGGGSVATMVIELATFASTNRLGIYDVNNHLTNRLEIFDGAGVAGSQALISFYDTGVVTVLKMVDGTPVFNSATFSTSIFGFYLDVYGLDVTPPDEPLGATDGDSSTLDYTVYTEDSHNAGEQAQALTFQGDDATTLNITGRPEGTFTDDQFIIAFEELLREGYYSDENFTDFIVLVDSITPVPGPAAIVLGFIGLGMIGMQMRKHA